MKLKYIGNRPAAMSCVSHPRLEKGPYNFAKRICEVDAKDVAFLLEQNPRSFEVINETVSPDKTVPPEGITKEVTEALTASALKAVNASTPKSK